MLRSLAMLTGALSAGAWPASAVEPAPTSGGPRVAKLFSRELDTHPDESLTLVSLTFEPGAQSKPHRHPGPVLVYVLEGALEMQIGEGPLTTVREGETFYEASGVVHSVARNPHATKPAKAIAFMLGKSDAPLTKPA